MARAKSSSFFFHAIVATLFALAFGISHSAFAYVGPPYLTPAQPTENDLIEVNMYSDECDIVDGGVVWPPPVTTQDDQITILLTGSHEDDPLFCIFGPGVETFPVGTFPPGSYTLDVERRYTALGGWIRETLGDLDFTVTGVAPPAVAAEAPALSNACLFLLVLATAGIALRGLRARRVVSLPLLASAFLSLPVRAQDVRPDQVIELLVTTASGAPTAEALVAAYRNGPPASPPLRGLGVGDPQKIAYLLPVRAEGDALAQLQRSPDSVAAELERYVVVIYPAGTDLERPLSALRSDPYVMAAYVPMPTTFSSDDSSPRSEDDGSRKPETSGQYGRDDLNVDAAWNIAGGYALIADIDSGLYTAHSALRQFNGSGVYIGGNFVPVASLDISLTGLVDPPQNSDDVDERRAMRIENPACNSNVGAHPNLRPELAGHGTHVAGLIGARGDSVDGVKGICEFCGIAMWKVSQAYCDTSAPLPRVSLAYNDLAKTAALKLSGDIGAQVVNMSFGRPTAAFGPTALYCQSSIHDPDCLAIAHAAYRDIVMVASSGNGRTQLDFPAADPRVVSAGGFEQSLALWDLWPSCPAGFGTSQCGSNFTTNVAYGARQELVASAQSVLSTTYPGYNWNSVLECGDQFPGPGFGNGIGWCTGTSMSAPQIAGVFGIVRSINPLVASGASPTTAGSLRSVLAASTVEAHGNPLWNPQTGYGHPDAAAAARRMLGKVGGAPVRNRVTPLFRLYSSGSRDYVDTTSPQVAVALMINTKFSWQPVAALPTVPHYPSFPHDPADGVLAAPRASVYVMTTEVSPRAEWPALRPLYLMDKDVPGGREVDDFLLATTTADIEYAHGHGYNLRTIQGYVYQPCSPEPNCIPPGAKRFYRACKVADGDCATFLQSEMASFAAAGYTTTFPPTSETATLLGYAYPATDSDGDGLPDGFEYVVGTNPMRADSDGDRIADADEFPMVGVPAGDPCAGGTGVRYCGADSIFKNGFDAGGPPTD
jgi:hypothetical protein